MTQLLSGWVDMRWRSYKLDGLLYRLTKCECSFVRGVQNRVQWLKSFGLPFVHATARISPQGPFLSSAPLEESHAALQVYTQHRQKQGLPALRGADLHTRHPIPEPCAHQMTRMVEAYPY